MEFLREKRKEDEQLQMFLRVSIEKHDLVIVHVLSSM